MTPAEKRTTEDLERLTAWVKDPAGDGLKSYTERIMIAIASNDQARAPGNLRDEPHIEWKINAWSEMDEHQQAVVSRYQQAGGFDPAAGMDADQLIKAIRGALASLWDLPLPEDARRAHLETVKAIIDVHYLKQEG